MNLKNSAGNIRSPGEVQPLWQPDPSRIASAQITEFARNHGCSDYQQLYQWSLEHPGSFWSAIWDYGRVVGSREQSNRPAPTTAPTSIAEPSGELPIFPSNLDGVRPDQLSGRWFPSARLNFAENLLRRGDEAPALIFLGEDQTRREISFLGLRDLVSQLQQEFVRLGVTTGDRIAGYLPNLPETIAAMLATTALGAVWSSTSPDFGVRGVIERFSQIQPKVLIVADHYLYNGKRIDLLSRIPDLVAELPSVIQVIVLPYHGRGGGSLPADSFSNAGQLEIEPNAVPGKETGQLIRTLEQICSDFGPRQPSFVPLPFNHPIYILYSSGTTGAPKCIIHGAGGTLLQHLKELQLHTDIRGDDRLFYFTTCGWMMWNWMVSALAIGTTLILFDGSPFAPQADRLWQLAAAERITHFGTSAKYLLALEKSGVKIKSEFDLSALKTILSTGSPLPPTSFEYVYRDIASDVCLSSISGGTDIISCFALGNPTLPVYSGEIQCLGLGMAVEVYDEQGLPCQPTDRGTEASPQKGELVCTKPFPSMPVAFWNDPAAEKYRGSYFDTYPNIWRHGDWCEITERGGMIIYGRSDAVLNPGGVRIGTAEIYRQVEVMPEIAESLVTAQSWDNDERIVLFVKLKSGELSPSLRDNISQQIRSQLTPRHVPAKIIQVQDIPKTLNGKISELAVKNILNGRPVRNRDALANPECLAEYENRPELQT